jgi:hypothetical protein
MENGKKYKIHIFDMKFKKSKKNRFSHLGLLFFLAVEVWTDVLGFVKRIQLARTVSLTNRRIHQICWPRLHGDKVVAHEVREITIVGRERFERGRPPKAFVLKDGKPVPIPSCPPPPYISGFHCIIT